MQMTVFPKTPWKKLSFLNASSKCLSEDCPQHAIWGFGSGVRWRPICRVGSVSSAGMVSVIAVFFMVEQQVVQCTEQIPLLSSLPQVLFFSRSPFFSVSDGWSLRCRPVWTLLSSLRYRSSIILPLATFSVSSRLFCLWKNPNYWSEKNINNQDLLCPSMLKK